MKCLSVLPECHSGLSKVRTKSNHFTYLTTWAFQKATLLGNHCSRNFCARDDWACDLLCFGESYHPEEATHSLYEEPDSQSPRCACDCLAAVLLRQGCFLRAPEPGLQGVCVCEGICGPGPLRRLPLKITSAECRCRDLS